MLKSNLRILGAALFAATALGLASCNETYTELPKAEQGETILKLDEKITHNNLEDLYETIVPSDSTSAEKVLNEILLRTAQVKFGFFYDTTETVKLENGASQKITHTGIHTIVSQKGSLTEDAYKAKVRAWAQNDVASGDLTYSHIDAFGGASLSDDELTAKVTDYHDHILEAIQKQMWSNVVNASYQDRNYFIERKFALEQFSNLYDIEVSAATKRAPIDGSKNYANVDEFFADDYLTVYKDYINRSILPDILRKALVEDYIISNNYTALGHSGARKVQYIALKDIENYSLANQRLITAYAERVLEASKEEMATFAGVAIDDEHVASFRNFHYLDRLYNGVTYADDAQEQAMTVAIYKEALFDAKSFVAGSGETITYYPATKLGAIYEDYLKGEGTSRWDSGSTADFTGSGAYTRDTGLMLKERETLALNGVTEGWFTSSELTTIASSDLKARLFKINVANEVDSLDPKEAGTSDDSLNYVCYRQGSYYLVPATRPNPTEGEGYHPYLIYDSSSSSWLMIRIDEAVKGSKLDTRDAASGYNYKELASLGRRDGKATQNQIVLTVAGLLGGSDTYAKAAKQSIVEKANITYHDQSAYDYFSTTFPDLFD